MVEIDNGNEDGHSNDDWNESDDSELVMEKHIDFIDIQNDGVTLVGASSLNTRRWTGGVWLFQQPESAPDITKCSAYYCVETGVACGKLVDGLGIRAILGLDSGYIALVGWERRDSDDDGAGRSRPRAMQQHASEPGHDGVLLCLDTFRAAAGGCGAGDAGETTCAATGGSDGSVRVWDLETMVTQNTYRGAHQRWVTGVSCHPGDPRQLVSSSLDGYVLLWDTRSRRPATVLARMDGDAAQCVAWSPTDVARVAVGWQSGAVTLHNTYTGADSCPVRHLSSPATAASPAAAAGGGGDGDVIGAGQFVTSRPVHALRWHSDHQWLAVCSDSPVVSVLRVHSDCKYSVMYSSSDTHTEMVRGLSWHTPLAADGTGSSTALPALSPSSSCSSISSLYACDWSGHVLCHSVSLTSSSLASPSSAGLTPASQPVSAC